MFARFLILSGWVCAVSLPLSTLAASKPVKGSVTIFQQKSFDLSQVSLPAHFAGLNVMQWVAGIEKSLIVKGEFETSAEFSLREQDALKRNITAELSVQSLLAIALKPFEARYDADTGVMHVDFAVGDGSGRIRAFSSQEPRGVYTGANAYGLKKTIYLITEKQVDLIAPEVGAGLIRTFMVEIHDRVKAKAIKDNLKLLLIGLPRGMSFGKATNHRQPQIDNPFDVTIEKYEIPFESQQVWIYDETGTIYGKYVLDAKPIDQGRNR